MAQQCLTTGYKRCGGSSEYSDAMEQGLRSVIQGITGRASAGDVRIKLMQEGGTYVVPVMVNNAIKLGFVLDTGASDVTIPTDVFSTLVRAGTISESDITGSKTYEMADGTKTSAPTFTIKSLKIGSAVVTNVSGAVAPAQGALLLGQSFLSHFATWSIDNSTHELILRSAR
jgi:clan AA aspartic protease (TIGR02281 family)